MAPKLIVVSGWTGAGKSTIADELGREFNATVASFDWLMSGLRAFDDIWQTIELPVERQRAVGWSLLSRVAEQQLRRGSSCILDLVARATALPSWQSLAQQYDASFHLIECVCSDIAVHRSRVEGRYRAIPGWYELQWTDVERGRQRYEPLPGLKLVLDAINPLENNIAHAREFVSGRHSAA